MKILVLGAPGSGLEYAHRALREAGYDVGMDEIKRDGMVYCVDHRIGYSLGGFRYTYHLVHNPLAAIPRIRKFMGGRTTLSEAADFWMWAVQTIEKDTKRFIRIEEMRAMWPLQLLKPTNFSKPRRAKFLKPLSVKKLYGEIPDGDRIIEKANTYGYHIYAGPSIRSSS